MSWSTAVEAEIRQFAHSLGVNELLVRTDRAPEIPTAPRGGFVVPLREVQRVANRFLTNDRILFLLEPRSPFRDVYSLGLLRWSTSDPIVVEIVGRGFDAGDLKRGDISPHERFAIRLSAGKPFEVLTHDVASQSEYEASISARRAKFTKLAEWTNDVPSAPPPQYTPIPKRLLDTVLNEVGQLEDRLPRLGLPGAPYMTSVTLWGDELERFYWDIVWPDLKYAGEQR